MFYSEDKINIIKICKKCNKEYIDPRLLPCGNSMCNFCIKETFSKSLKMKCILCKKIHKIPAKGFPKNKAIKLLLNKKSKIIYRSSKDENLRELIDQLQEKLDNFNFIKTQGDFIIKSHFSSLRNELQLQTELLIEKVNKFSDDLMNSINENEQKLSLIHI